MASPRFAATPSGFVSPKPVSFIAANGTAAKVLVEPQAAAVAADPQPAFYGGQTVLDIVASSTDGSGKDVIVYQGNVLTTQDATATGDITVSAQNTLTRAVGSFISNGWLVGDLLMVFAPVDAAQVVSGIDGVLGTVTDVTAPAITLNGTPLASGTNVLTAGTRVVNVSQIFRATVAANSGNASSTPNVRLLGNANDQTIFQAEWKLGSTSMLIVGMQAAVSALPAFVSICARSAARY